MPVKGGGKADKWVFTYTKRAQAAGVEKKSTLTGKRKPRFVDKTRGPAVSTRVRADLKNALTEKTGKRSTRFRETWTEP